MVLDPALHAPTDRIDAEVRVLATEPKPLGTWHAGAPPHRRRLEVGARIVPLGAPIAPGATGLAQLVLDRPIAAAVLDRFILRDASARRTIGGGRFLDLRAPARQRRTPERLAFLAAAAEPDPGRCPRGAARGPAVLVDVPPSPATARWPTPRPTPRFAASGAAAIAGIAVAPGRLADLRTALAADSRRLSRREPRAAGHRPRAPAPRASLPRLPREPFLAFLRAEAEAGRAVLDGAFVRLPGHEVRLSPEDEALCAVIAPRLGDAARFRPPRVRDLAGDLGLDEREVRRVLKLCARMGRVDEIAHDHFFLRATTAEMVALAADVAARAEGGWFTAAAFRDRMDNGRKVAIQILDFLDRAGVTLRRGDLRRIDPHRLDLFGDPPTATMTQAWRDAATQQKFAAPHLETGRGSP